jgi:hypothetical protein
MKMQVIWLKLTLHLNPHILMASMLTASQRHVRAFLIVALLGFMAYAWLLNPSSSTASTWSLSGFRNLTGLPCPLCGGTRATHYLLQGNLERTLYYNWLAIPSLLIAITLVLTLSLELLHGRLYLPRVQAKISPSFLLTVILSVLVIWFVHIYDALQSPKPELLNSQGLYFKLKPGNNPLEP